MRFIILLLIVFASCGTKKSGQETNNVSFAETVDEKELFFGENYDYLNTSKEIFFIEIDSGYYCLEKIASYKNRIFQKKEARIELELEYPTHRTTTTGNRDIIFYAKNIVNKFNISKENSSHVTSIIDYTIIPNKDIYDINFFETDNTLSNYVNFFKCYLLDKEGRVGFYDVYTGSIATYKNLYIYKKCFH